MVQDGGIAMKPRGARARSDAMAQSPRGERRGWQIGPRIRVGGTLGKIGQDVKIAAGKAASNPIVQGIAGAVFSPAAAAALAAAGKALDTSKGGLHGVGGVVDLAKAGVTGYGAGKIGDVVKNVGSNVLKNGVSSIWSGGGADAKGNLGMLGDLAGKVAGGGGIPGVSSLSNFLGGGDGGGMDWAKLGLAGLAGAQGLNAMNLSKRSGDLANEALDTVKGDWKNREALRTAGKAGMLNPTRVADISGILANSGPYGGGVSFTPKPPVRPV